MPGDTTRDGVLVAVATYHRNDELASLLPLLVAEAGHLQPPAAVLVVDNDPDAGARPVVAAAPAVGYRHEPRPGIAAARNAALDAAAGHQRFVVFIDDDEYPRPGWLRTLLDTRSATDAVATAGRVVSEFTGEPHPWVIASGLFERRRRPTGTSMHAAATNNLVIDTDRTDGLRFDDRLGLLGGSDNLFTRTLIGRGGRVTWCDEAVVVDRVPADRATRDWVLRRAYRLGNSEVTVSLLLAASGPQRLQARVRAVAGGLLRVAAGSALHLAGRLGGRLRADANGARMRSRGRGHVAGALGRTYGEYLRPS